MFAARIATRPTMAIASPCNKICTIDPRSGLCRGCGRTLDEIARWMSLGESERCRIMAELPLRLGGDGPGGAGRGRRGPELQRSPVLSGLPACGCAWLRG